MTNIEREVLELIRKTLTDEEIDSISDWKCIFGELLDQAIYCLPYAQLSKSDLLRKEEKNQYRLECLKNLTRNVQILRAQTKLVQLLQTNDVPFVVLKGSAASMYYPHPEYRCMGDIDIIVKPEDFEKANRVLEKEYVLEQAIEDCPLHAGYMSPEGFEIELHKYFSILNNNKKLDEFIYEGIDRCQWHELQGQTFPSLPPVENGLVLLYHIYQHLEESGIGYRQVIDFREFANKNKEILDEFLLACEKTHLRGLAEIMLTLCQKHLGLDIEFKKKMNIQSDSEEYLLSLFSSSGNFGSKIREEEDNKAEIVLKNFKNPIHGFKILQKYGLENWSLAQKYIVLRPFAWIYQIFRYAGRIRNYGGLKTVVQGSKRVNDKNQLFKELKLTKNY
ncbi:MAG: nucleotidyltransferase family protein [Bacillota bacterium]|nr:nucleotidyltransferase family protein [Bacillota bacterium]